MRRINTISSKYSMNTYCHVFQMTRNLLEIKKQKKFLKRKFFRSKNAETHKYPKNFCQNIYDTNPCILPF